MIHEHLNAAADALRDLALDRGTVSLVVLGVIALAWLPIRRRASSHLASWLWLLPLVPLAVPVERWTPDLAGGAPRRWVGEWVGSAGAPRATLPPASAAAASLPFREGDTTPERAVPRTMPAGAGSDDPDAPDAAPAASRDASTRARLSGSAWIVILWAIVAFGLLTAFVINQIRTARFVARLPALPDDAPAARLMRQLVRETGTRAVVRLSTTEHLASPATWGWSRPTIMLPPALLERLTPIQLRWVLLHELAHVRRGDVVITGIQRIVQIAWWFHPLVWIVNGIVAHWRECACDDAASAGCRPRTRNACAAAFLEVVAASSDAARSIPAGVAPLVDGKAHVRRRLMRLMDMKRSVTIGLSPAGVLMLIASATAGFGIAGAQAPDPSPPVTPPKPITLRALEAPAPSTVDAQLNDAVAWLCKMQQADGGWRASTDPAAKRCGFHNHVHVTALAVLGLSERQKAEPSERGARAIERGLTWLLAQQGEDGAIGVEHAYTLMAGHLMAMLAFCERQATAPTPALERAIRHGVRYLIRAQNTRMGWRYGVKPGDNDAQITSLALVALHKARALGVDVPSERLNWGYGLLDDLADEKTGRVGLIEKGSHVGRLWQHVERFPPQRSEEITALGLLAWLADGRDPAKDPRMAKAIGVVMAIPPAWRTGSVDYMYWTFGTLALKAIGGYQRRAWNEALERSLAPQFRREGECWPAADAWSLPGMQVYPTAMALWALSTARAK